MDDNPRIFMSVKKLLNLVLEENLAEAKDMSYVTSGYAPLSCRLVQLASRKVDGWNSNPAILKALGTPVYAGSQLPAAPASGEKITGAKATTAGARNNLNHVFFFFIL